MTRDEMLDAVYDEVTANDTCVEDAVVSLLEEIVRLRCERDALRQQLAVVGVAAHGGDISDVPSNYRTDTSDKVVKMARILAALREPSEAVLAAAESCYRDEVVAGALRMTLRAAVAAAEQEVQGER